jgi:histidine kinase
MSLVKKLGSSVTVSSASGGSVERDGKGGDVSNNESSRFSKSVTSDLSGDSKLSRPSITTTLVPRPRKSNDLSDFTIDKLNYASLGLHGREIELKLLENALNNLVSGASTEDERQLVLISGYSGTGKTALAINAFKSSTEKLGGLFVRGKFDLNLRSQPYSGITAACAEICAAILKLKNHKLSIFEQLCSQIKAEVGSELALLTQVIPALTDVVDVYVAESPIATNSRGKSERSQGGMSSSGSKHQFNFAFLRFIRAISYQFVPLVFVLDDLQWADVASLDLLDVLLTDPNSSKLMVVGIYRSNEVDETHIFHHALADMKAKSQEKYFKITQVEVGNIEFDAVHEIIRELLDMESDTRTFGLADVCHKKTHGNVFFLLQFLSMLKERQFLQFNFGSLSWTWDNEEIESSTGASDNVVDLLKAKMAELPKNLVDILKLASCLGSTFEVGTLNIVWERSTALSLGDEQVLMTSLEVLEDHGYILKRGAESTHQNYTWGHDKIQEGALSLIPETERGAFVGMVGRILLSHLDENELDSAIFVVVNLLNGADDRLIKDDKARLDLARLNYEAGCKAISLSAFESAAAYAAKGVRLLPENAWINQYDLTLNVHTIGAQAEGFIGNTEMMERYCTTVLSQDRPMEDKFGVYYTWIDSLIHRGKLDEARDHLLEILQKFKCRFPKNVALVGLVVVSNVVRIKSTMKSRDASKLVILSDTKRIELMKILDKLATVFYMLKDDRMPLAIFRSLNWTMKYGHCDYSSCTFATTGMMLTGILNDFQGGSKYGEQALALMERSKSQATAARTTFCVYAFLFPWTKLLRSLLKPLLQGYDIGLQTG